MQSRIRRILKQALGRLIECQDSENLVRILQMKVKNLETLQDKLDYEMSWRRQEIIRMQIRSVSNSTDATTLRSAYLLLYSNWERYIRVAAHYYTIFVFSRDISLMKLTDGFQAIYFENKIKNVRESKKTVVFQQFLQYLHGQEGIAPHRKYNDELGKRFVNTDSNLNFERLNNIIKMIGISTDFSLRKEWIDNHLLNSRNKIAHGERPDLSTLDFKQTSDQVLFMMDKFTRDILDAAEAETFIRT